MDTNNYDKIMPFKPENRESELKIAVRFQRRLIPSKIVYFYIGFMGLLVLLQKYQILHISNFNELMDWLILLFVLLGVYSVISTVFLTICPYCHRFQKQFNGKVISVDNQEIACNQGVVSFIHYCNRCNAPLSPKAVTDYYENKA